MADSGSAGPVDQSSTSENQDKTMDMYFGVFFDVYEIDAWFNAIGNYRNKGERWKEGFESDIQDSKYGKVAMIVEGTAKTVADKLPPNNPVSKALDAKDKVFGYKDKAEGIVDDVGGFIDDKSDKVLDTVFTDRDGIDPTGSKRSIISMMEPAYCGGLFVGDSFWSDYNYRIYVQGSVLAFDFKSKKSTDDGDTSEADGEISEEDKEEFRAGQAQKAVQEAIEAIKGKIGKAPKGTKLSVHFDIFGYDKDASIDNLESEINNLKGEFPDINEINIDYTGKYENLNDPDEVGSDLGETKMRFRNTKFLEK